MANRAGCSAPVALAVGVVNLGRRAAGSPTTPTLPSSSYRSTNCGGAWRIAGLGRCATVPEAAGPAARDSSSVLASRGYPASLGVGRGELLAVAGWPNALFPGETRRHVFAFPEADGLLRCQKSRR